MKFPSALLEDWMRDHYHSAAIDIGSSGVLDYSLQEVRVLGGIDSSELDEIIFRDSPCCGRDDLREAIASRWTGGHAERVMTTHGASEAIYATMMSLLSPGDQVVALKPAYHTHVSVAESIGCEVRRWQLREEEDFEPNLDTLAGLVTENTRIIIVNFPHNPTGATLSPYGLERLFEIADSVDAYIVWDAAFSDLVYDGELPLPDPTLRYSKAVSIGTFSKAYGLPGMRFGWCIGDPGLIEQMSVLRDMLTLSISPITEFLALRVIQNADAFIQPRLENAAANRRLLINWVLRHNDLVSMSRPKGGVTAFPRICAEEDTTNLCARLAKVHGVLLIPGSAFGDSRRVRLGFGGDSNLFEKGLNILVKELTGDPRV